MTDDILNWRVEAVCRHAWPAAEEIVRGDWCLRLNNGYSRRANSANPLRATGGDMADLIDWAETEFATRNQRAIFRVPDIIDSDIDRQLAARGYEIETITATIHAELFPMPMRRDPDVMILDRPSDDWMNAMGRLQQWDSLRLRHYRNVVTRVEVPAGFMALSIGGDIAAMAYGALHDNLVCLESVVTNPAMRRRGYGSRLIGALLAWGIEREARGACLQVDSGNAAALSLYRGMGFIRDLYSYRYRVKPIAA